jgi:LEA14-like dessication related protein
MKKSKVVILPFKITISDLPIVVYEAGMFAENMIVLDTNGVSEIANKFKGYVAKDSDEIFYYLKKILTKNYDEL